MATRMAKPIQNRRRVRDQKASSIEIWIVLPPGCGTEILSSIFSSGASTGSPLRQQDARPHAPVPAADLGTGGGNAASTPKMKSEQPALARRAKSLDVRNK